MQLQNIVVEQSDELDRTNSQLELIKHIKHASLMGDQTRAVALCTKFQEQADQLVEACRMLNQVAPTNKIKISTRSLAIWFETNTPHLVRVCAALSQQNRSRELKDFAWIYSQGEIPLD